MGAGMTTAVASAARAVALTVVATTVRATIMRGRRNRQRRAARPLRVKQDEIDLIGDDGLNDLRLA